MSTTDAVVYFLPLVIIVGMWAWFISRMKKSAPFSEVRKVNAEILDQNREIIRLLNDIKGALENSK